MKLRHLLAMLALAIATPAHAAEKHEHAPRHGGILVEVRDLDFELVAKPESLQLYVSDHGKAVDLSKATARITLLAGTQKQEVALMPAGNRFEAKGTFKVGPGTKAVALVTIAGKSSTARFAMK